MRKSFEDRRRKPVKPSKIASMAEYINIVIVRVILAKTQPRVFAK